jgi:hypothetical protein
MNEYGWGKMMDDYVFLEDVSRKVGDWGREIVRGGYSFGNVNGRDNRGRGRGIRGGRGRGGGSGSGRTKRDVLKLQLEVRDIDVDLLPIGMERRKVNQSSWDFKYVFIYTVLSIIDGGDLKKSNSFINHRIQILQTVESTCAFFTTPRTAFYPTNAQK